MSAVMWVRLLEESGHEAWVLDNLSQGHRGAVREGRLIEGDLMRPNDLAAALDQTKADAVMHFAALALVGERCVETRRILSEQRRRYAQPVGGRCASVTFGDSCFPVLQQLTGRRTSRRFRRTQTAGLPLTLTAVPNWPSSKRLKATLTRTGSHSLH